MPFQVSYSAKATPVGVINFFSAGEDQVTVCDTLVTLTATLVGDLTGHTIIWEQLTGPAVAFTSPLNQLVVTYTVASFEDRSFRFTIDKGTGGEQFDDVNIYGAPTFDAYLGGLDANCIINYGNVLRGNAPTLKILDAWSTTGEGVVECLTSSTSELYWEHPTEYDLVLQYLVQERSIAGPWNTEAVLPRTTNNHTPLNLGSTYRVVVVRRELNSVTSNVASNTKYHDGIIGDSINTPEAAASDAASLGGSGIKPTVPSYTVSLVTLLKCDPDNFQDAYLGGLAGAQHVSIPSFTVDLLTLISCDPDNFQDAYLGGSAGAQDMVLPTYTVLDLDGGDIGG